MATWLLMAILPSTPQLPSAQRATAIRLYRPTSRARVTILLKANAGPPFIEIGKVAAKGRTHG